MNGMEKLGFESLDDKVIFLTGASNGIGRATALLFGEYGAQLVLTARSEDKLNDVADRIEDNGKADRPLVIPTDVTVEEECVAAVERTIEEFGRIDVLINNAGIGIPSRDLSEVDSEVIKQQIETNLYGVFYLTREALKPMKDAQKGHIVMVSSMAGVNSNPVAPLYCSSKFGLEGYTGGLKDQAEQWREDGIDIRVSNVKPGPVDSGYWGDRDVPRDKFMTCEEMAATLYWVVAAADTMNVGEIRMESMR
ncbi:MAG: SDR family oxidoreductase [Planctomycetota bacterium]